jgi:DNA-3-methyladenine glycosylase II
LTPPSRPPQSAGVFFDPPKVKPDWSRALRALRRDPILRPVIARVGPCTLAPRNDAFISLVQSIYAQQISTKIATTLYLRFAEKFPRRKPTPALVVKALSGAWPDDEIKRCGLSRQKRAYVHDLAGHFCRREINPRQLARADDETVIESLTRVKGIGRWTAEMFLMFNLNRPDVLPVDDLGIREAVRQLYALQHRPKADELRAIAEPWRPWRTIACWYLWRGFQ